MQNCECYLYAAVFLRCMILNKMHRGFIRSKTNSFSGQLAVSTHSFGRAIIPISNMT